MTSELKQEIKERVSLLINDPQAREVFLNDMTEWNAADEGLITEQDLIAVYSELSGIEVLDEELFENVDYYDDTNYDYLVSTRHIPIDWDENTIKIAVADPYSTGEIAYNWFCNKRLEVNFVLARRTLIERTLTKIYENVGNEDSFIFDGDDSEQTLRDLAREAPIVRLVNDVFARAVEMGASDIHVEPTEDMVYIRYRIDGVLQTVFTPPLQQFPAIASRIKLIGGLNIAERRLPQDGRIELNIGKAALDVRLSTLPSMHGESIVMRLLQKNVSSFKLTTIGMLDDMQDQFKKLIKRPHGLFLVVGPTGSGKTTTLYCVLNILNSGLEKIITVEDPVEYQINGITQIQVKANIGLTFAAGLRSIVRQDPDIILVGEIRDLETAEICIHAALTGHLVFSTLHTNDAAGAVSRLQDMGVENFLIASSLAAVLSQRLVRRICTDCNGSGHDDVEGRKCRRCSGTGFKGRLGIYELLVVNDEVRRAITHNKNASEIAEIAISHGMIPIRKDGEKKVESGLTKLSEVARVSSLDSF